MIKGGEGLKTAYVVGAGAFCARGFHPRPDDVVVAADGGLDALLQLSIRPQLVVGDMDSQKLVPPSIPRLRFPSKKDQTDLALALLFLKARGLRRFLLYGAGGGRMDHSLANFQLLQGLAQEGMQARLIDPHYTALSLFESKLWLPPLQKGRVVSVFALSGQAQGVSLSGLAYPLHNATLSPTLPLGVSNRARGLPIGISVKKGGLVVLVMQAQAESRAMDRLALPALGVRRSGSDSARSSD